MEEFVKNANSQAYTPGLWNQKFQEWAQQSAFCDTLQGVLMHTTGWVPLLCLIISHLHVSVTENQLSYPLVCLLVYCLSQSVQATITQYHRLSTSQTAEIYFS